MPAARSRSGNSGNAPPPHGSAVVATCILSVITCRLLTARGRASRPRHRTRVSGGVHGAAACRGCQVTKTMPQSVDHADVNSCLCNCRSPPTACAHRIHSLLPPQQALSTHARAPVQKSRRRMASTQVSRTHKHTSLSSSSLDYVPASTNGPLSPPLIPPHFHSSLLLAFLLLLHSTFLSLRLRRRR